MRASRSFGALRQIRYRPELTSCPHCGSALAYSHQVWDKVIQSFSETAQVSNLGFRCEKLECAFGRAVYRSARAEALQIKGSGYGLDVIVHIGYLRFKEHRTRGEIWRELIEEKSIKISERHVQNLIEVYLALLRASERDLEERLGGVVKEHGGIVLSLDGLQPEKGNEQLWMVREVLGGEVLAAANLAEGTASALEELLCPIKETGLPVLGVISDAQESVRIAVGNVFPNCPLQVCQYHALRDAGGALWRADHHLLVQAKKELRGIRKVEESVRRAELPDPGGEVVLDTIAALRQVVLEQGVAPLDFAGLRAAEELGALGQTLDRCLEKRGIVGLLGCVASSGERSRYSASERHNCG